MAVIEDGAIAEEFVLNEPAGHSAPRKTALGRELAAFNAANTLAGTHREAAHV